MSLDTRAIGAELRSRLGALDAELGGLTEVPRDPMAPLGFGKRIGDGTTEAVDRLAKVGAAKELAAMRADVARALQKIEDGTYGSCDRCGAPIADERLEARPASILCVRCAAGRG
ncbi:MAG: TraR/DksA family transcriptional regulator [Planctomycetaceae bacterium]